ncbi:hypothetical protein [Wenxinia marina]|uniref:Uncharacterized protein n=1 Tax=Wenxinia marina DSM 24838 TaxID=1123501 RepID=A0A0D0Q3J3_9RHOB|nr:hypothetical protein [Wenxinia marina]KIQ69099.1 hypothetical protein Wenmar_02168 [Wenxinia marina DSM 24838]GGL70246.1 hypothetical protein GCM10011392_26090 [Wenxinia marina]
MHAKGSAPVGSYDDLDPLGRAAVSCLRALRRDAALPAAGPLADLCGLCARFGRRPLSAHAEECPCLGGDEACFARLVELAAAGEREEALMLAMLLVRADVAPLAVAMAEQAGLGVMRMATGAGARVH